MNDVADIICQALPAGSVASTMSTDSADWDGRTIKRELRRRAGAELHGARVGIHPPPRPLTSDAAIRVPLARGGALHSSTLQLNLSCFCRLMHQINQWIKQKLLTLS